MRFKGIVFEPHVFVAAISMGTYRVPRVCRLLPTCLFYFFLIRLLPENLCRDAAREVVPHREHGSGNGRKGEQGEMRRSQRSGQSGVLHAHLDGDGRPFGRFASGQGRQSVAQGQAEDVVQNHRHGYNQAARQDAGRVVCHDDADDEGDGQRGNHGQQRNDSPGSPVEIMVGGKSQYDGHNHHLHDTQNMPAMSTSTDSPASSHTRAGVRRGASRVETPVMATLRATSPLAR